MTLADELFRAICVDRDANRVATLLNERPNLLNAPVRHETKNFGPPLVLAARAGSPRIGAPVSAAIVA